MLFVDLESFDADTYDLRYLRNELFNSASCFVYSVTPKLLRQQGRFKGEIWVATETLKIVRIKGTFTAGAVPFLRRLVGGSIPIYLNFDSVRQEVMPGIWLPSYAFFDEKRTWRELNHNGETDFHYRGHTFIWHYRSQFSGIDLDHSRSANAVTQLESDGLLANQGVVEEALDNIVKRILLANNINLTDIRCRVLLTTPLEMYRIDHTLILSRGLLNIVPDDSVIPVLLSYEIANILLEQPRIDSKNNQDQPIASARQANSVAQSVSNNAAAWNRGLVFSKQANYSEGIDYTSWLLVQLAEHSQQIPHLNPEIFAPSILNAGDRMISTDSHPASPRPKPLSLRGKYTIDSWTENLTFRGEPLTKPTADASVQ